MTDRELLELAAKAAGLVFCMYHQRPARLVQPDIGEAKVFWNPLTDDGDALRLAHKLGLLSDVHAWPRTMEETRRAIVRAAAEIGKVMK